MTDEFDPKVVRDQSVRCAAEALRQELDVLSAVAPFDERSPMTTVAAWIEGFGRDRERLNEIVKRRNPWAAKFGETIPDFWGLVEKRIGLKPKA
jgi:hypothetical protein